MKVFILVFCILIWECSSPSNNNQNLTSGYVAPVSKQDTIPVDDSEPSYEDALSDLVKSYAKIIVIDSTYLVDTDSFSFKMKYYCTNDSGIEVPINYSWSENKKKLKTHNFLINLEILKNGEKVYSNKIDKSFCAEFIESIDLKRYGTIYFPKMKFKDGKIIISFNYSIPLSDIGKYVKFFWNDNTKTLVHIPD